MRESLRWNLLGCPTYKLQKTSREPRCTQWKITSSPRKASHVAETLFVIPYSLSSPWDHRCSTVSWPMMTKAITDGNIVISMALLLLIRVSLAAKAGCKSQRVLHSCRRLQHNRASAVVDTCAVVVGISIKQCSAGDMTASQAPSGRFPLCIGQTRLLNSAGRSRTSAPAPVLALFLLSRLQLLFLALLLESDLENCSSRSVFTTASHGVAKDTKGPTGRLLCFFGIKSTVISDKYPVA